MRNNGRKALGILALIFKYLNVVLYNRINEFHKLFTCHKNTLPQYPGWIHPGTFPGENEAYKISPRWKRFRLSTFPVCIGNLSHPVRNFELLMFTSEFLKFWYFPGDIAQAVFGSWLTVSVLKFIQAINSCFTVEGFIWTFLV